MVMRLPNHYSMAMRVGLRDGFFELLDVSGVRIKRCW